MIINKTNNIEGKNYQLKETKWMDLFHPFYFNSNNLKKSNYQSPYVIPHNNAPQAYQSSGSHTITTC